MEHSQKRMYMVLRGQSEAMKQMVAWDKCNKWGSTLQEYGTRQAVGIFYTWGCQNRNMKFVCRSYVTASKLASPLDPLLASLSHFTSSKELSAQAIFSCHSLIHYHGSNSGIWAFNHRMYTWKRFMSKDWLYFWLIRFWIYFEWSTATKGEKSQWCEFFPEMQKWFSRISLFRSTWTQNEANVKVV